MCRQNCCTSIPHIDTTTKLSIYYLTINNRIAFFAMSDSVDSDNKDYNDERKEFISSTVKVQ